MAQTLAQAVAGYPASDPDWQVAAALNEPSAATYGSKPVDVPVSAARALLMTSGAWGQIVLTAADTTQPAAVRALCTTVHDAMLNLDTFQMSDPATNASVTAMLGALLSATLISQATHDALLAMAATPMAWTDSNNGGVAVTARDVGIARGGIA